MLARLLRSLGATEARDAARRGDGATARAGDAATRQGRYDNPAAHIDEWHGSADGEGGGGIVCDWRPDCPLLAITTGSGNLRWTGNLLDHSYHRLEVTGPDADGFQALYCLTCDPVYGEILARTFYDEAERDEWENE